MSVINDSGMYWSRYCSDHLGLRSSKRKIRTQNRHIYTVNLRGLVNLL